MTIHRVKIAETPEFPYLTHSISPPAEVRTPSCFLVYLSHIFASLLFSRNSPLSLCILYFTTDVHPSWRYVARQATLLRRWIG